MRAMIPAGTARFIRRRHVTAVAIAAALAPPVIVCHPSPPLAVRGIATSASVCLLVRARLPQKPHVQTSLPVAVARSLTRMLRTSGFVDDVIFSHNRTWM